MEANLKSVSLFLLLAVAYIGLVGCSPSATSLKKTLEENPDILFNVIEKHPDKFLDVVNNAAREAQKIAREREMKDLEGQREEEFKNPKKPLIDPKRAMLGPQDAPITIVEYSDFQCPYCSRGYETVKEVMEAYKGKVRLIYKHLPLDFHPEAEPAARYFEAIALQSPEKAYAWHDLVFQQQERIKGEKDAFFVAMAKKVGADVAKVKKDLASDEVKARIAADMKEAKEYKFSGTPGFLINGVSLRGAYPASEFKVIIDRLLKDDEKK
jgi:protein-disulfide isomerase